MNLVLASVLTEWETRDAHWIQNLREEGLSYGPPKAHPVGNFEKKGVLGNGIFDILRGQITVLYLIFSNLVRFVFCKRFLQPGPTEKFLLNEWSLFIRCSYLMFLSFCFRMLLF